MKIFEYALIYHPRATKEDKDAGLTRKSLFINGGVKQVLAVDEQQVTILASRDIPDEYLDKLDQVQIAIRPF